MHSFLLLLSVSDLPLCITLNLKAFHRTAVHQLVHEARWHKPLWLTCLCNLSAVAVYCAVHAKGRASTGLNTAGRGHRSVCTSFRIV